MTNQISLPISIQNIPSQSVQQVTLSLLTSSTYPGRIINVQGLTKYGTFAFSTTTGGGRTPTTVTFRVDDIPISVVITGGSDIHGETWVSLGVSAGGVEYKKYCAGYITTYNPICGPMDNIPNSRDGRGYIRAITGTDPGAGNEIVELSPAYTVRKLKGFSATLVTGAVAGNRTLRIEIYNGAVVRASFQSMITTAAITTSTYNFFPGCTSRTTKTNNMCYEPMSYDIILNAGDGIRTVTTTLDAADDWGAPTLFVEEWSDV